MRSWKTENFKPKYLIEKFGDFDVQIYDDLFELQSIDSLACYFQSNFGKPSDEGRSKQYVRWYTKLKNIDFFWSDEVFKSLECAWSHPYFLPNSSLVIPYCPDSEFIDVTEARFPYKGLFISGKGARTKLHRDPFHSNAVLCQFYGQKKIILYPPEQQKYLMNQNEFVDIADPDLNKFKRFSEAEPAFETVLAPGEIIFFPSGWFHDVTAISDSISVTWNFVHASQKDDFVEYIDTYKEDDQLEIVRFFLEGLIDEPARVGEIIDFLEYKF